MPVRRAENIIREQPSEEMPLAHGGNFTGLQADRVCSNRDSGRCKQSLWGQVGRNKKNKQTKVGAADFQTLFHSQARTGAQNMTHVKFPLFVSIIRPQLHTHTHTPGVSYKHTQAWLIGSCTVITAEAIRLVPAPWATQQGVARQRGLV